jgi:hypothetical protein
MYALESRDEVGEEHREIRVGVLELVPDERVFLLPEELGRQGALPIPAPATIEASLADLPLSSSARSLSLCTF